MTIDRICRAFEAGQRANRGGHPIANNPHVPSHDPYHAWNAGWADEEGPRYVATPNTTRRKP